MPDFVTSYASPLGSLLGIHHDLDILRQLLRYHHTRAANASSLHNARLSKLAVDCGWDSVGQKRSRPAVVPGTQAAPITHDKRRRFVRTYGKNQSVAVSKWRGWVDHRLPGLTRKGSPLSTPSGQEQRPAQNGDLAKTCAIVHRTSGRRTCNSASWGCDMHRQVLWTRNGCAGKFTCNGWPVSCASSKSQGSGIFSNCSCGPW